MTGDSQDLLYKYFHVPAEIEKPWMKVGELAEETGIHPTTIRDWIDKRKILTKICECGNTRFVNVREFAKYVRNNYRYTPGNRSGRWWSPQEVQLENPDGRTQNAIKVKKCRMNKLVSE